MSQSDYRNRGEARRTGPSRRGERSEQSRAEDIYSSGIYASSRQNRRISDSRDQSGSRRGGSRLGDQSGIEPVSRAHTASRSRRNAQKRRRRKPPFDFRKIALLILVVAVVAAGTVWAVGAVGRGRGEKEADANVTSSGIAETELEKQVTVDGLAITGLSREDAKKALLDQYGWGMKITFGEEEYEVKNLIEPKIDEVLETIYTDNPKEDYTLDATGLEEAVKAEAAAAAALWDVPAKNSEIESFDKETGRFVYTKEQTGRVIDREQLAEAIQSQLASKNFKANIEVESNSVEPELNQAKAKEVYRVLGTYSTTTTNNKDRNTNIRLATDSLDGLVLRPGEEFSFNSATGERSIDKGYRPAGAYVNGVLVEEPGGGVCQVSTTLYNAVVFSGLTTSERHAHSYEPSYVTPGEDAMVSFGGPDMKFVNNSKYSIALRAQFSDSTLKISVVGVPVLDDDTVVEMSSVKIGELDPPAPVYEEDQTLQPGEEKVVKEAVKGSRWATKMVTKKNGEVISEELFHNSTYRGKPATIRRNTSGVVIPAEEPSSEPAGESSASAENGTQGESPSETKEQPSSSAPQETPSEPETEPSPTADKALEPSRQGPGQQNGETVSTVAPPPIN